ncbi:RHS repeat-associated core domain-containing protein [Xanthomonas sacchari]|uniref:RHS repeat-associated core domain-containing protein n=1 Tax=Xanthomonas sacchari TaxID=56458 RepID=UPI0022577680|nr:RHS repeat-associated core domain-containing protein [Xanthomonas sacchari]
MSWIGLLWVLVLALPMQALAETVEYFHTDALGTPIAVTDASGNLIETSEYEPYGKLLNRPVTDGPGFTGHVQDAATGLTYMQQRYYDPNLGRFLSVDPVAVNSASGANFSRYWYANDNPYRFLDPDGRETIECGSKSSCPRQIKVADLKAGDVIKTNGATITIKENTIEVRFNEGYESGSAAAKVGPNIIPISPKGVSVGENIKKAKAMSPFQFRDQVKNKGPWDYKQLSGKYEQFGNFNYGATGRAISSGIGFSSGILLEEAGRAQQAAGTSNPAWGSAGVRGLPGFGTQSNGDDPVDQFWIQQGIRYHDAGSN